MLTLIQDKKNVLVCYIRKGKKRTPVYYHPVIKDSLRNSVDNLDYFFKDENFRDEFQLNRQEATDIQKCLETGQVCEQFQKKKISN